MVAQAEVLVVRRWMEAGELQVWGHPKQHVEILFPKLRNKLLIRNKVLDLSRNT